MESFELIASNPGGGNCGVICGLFLGVGLHFVIGLRKGKHILEKSCLRHEEVLVYTVQATVDLNHDSTARRHP